MSKAPVIRNTPIRVYSPDLRYLGTIENHTSLIWTRKYYEPGDFEIHAPITPKNLRLLQTGNIISKRGSTEAGVIEDVENEESDIKNEATRKGRFLSSYFDFRLIGGTVVNGTVPSPMVNFSGLTEVAMRQLVAGVPPIPLVELGALQGFTERVEFQATMKNLNTHLGKLARGAALGYRLRPDFKQKKLFFEVYKGVDRTLSQGINARVIFSESYQNLNNAIYKYNNQRYRTQIIVGGEGEYPNRVYVVIGGGSGLALRQQFVDAKDISSEGLTAAQYRAALTQRGLEKQADNAIAESMECETEAEVNFTYKLNYDLGDVVTVDKRAWGIKMNKRITELAEYHQFGGMFVAPTLGDALPEKIDWGD